MQLIPLTQNYSFAIERYEKLRVRLMIYKNGELRVCRKESAYKLNQFLTQDEAKAFKGRLQLFKHHDDIAVEVKGQPVGTISVADMRACIAASAI